MTNARRLLVTCVLAGAAAAGCEGGKTATSVDCKTFSTAQALCNSQGCDPTWSTVQTNHAYCDCGFNRASAGDCGDYHVLETTGVDTGARYYYRRDTGTLVYAQFFSPPSPNGTCMAVGTVAFSPPASCDSSTLSPLPGWCSPDGGGCPDGGAAP